MASFNYHYQPEIVFKVKDKKTISGNDESDLTSFFRHHAQVDWKALFLAHPHIQIKRLFCTLQPIELAPLIEKARQLDASYQDPELLSYFIIVCQTLADATGVLQRLQHMKPVETAYLRGRITDPAVTVKKNDYPLNRDT